MAARDPDGILVTRPADAASVTAKRLSAIGWRPVLAPMLEIVGVATALPDPTTLQAVLITSANAVAHLPAALHGVPLLAVGDATAEQARRAGFRSVASAGADATALARLARERCDPSAGPLLLAGAEDQGAALARLLADDGFAVSRCSVYAAQPVHDLSDAAMAELAGNRIAACMFFSPATARAFVAAFMRACPLQMVFTVEALAISEEAAHALTPLPWRRIRVARRPNQDELLALLS